MRQDCESPAAPLVPFLEGLAGARKADRDFDSIGFLERARQACLQPLFWDSFEPRPSGHPDLVREARDCHRHVSIRFA